MFSILKKSSREDSIAKILISLKGYMLVGITKLFEKFGSL